MDNITYPWVELYFIFYIANIILYIFYRKVQYYIYYMPFIAMGISVVYFAWAYLDSPQMWHLRYAGGMMLLLSVCMAFYTALLTRLPKSKKIQILVLAAMLGVSMLPPSAVWHAGKLLQSRMAAIEPPPACFNNPIRLDFNGKIVNVLPFRQLYLAPNGPFQEDLISETGNFEFARNYDFTAVCLASANAPVQTASLLVEMLPDDPKDFVRACDSLHDAQKLKNAVCNPPPDIADVVNKGLPGAIVIHNAKDYQPVILDQKFDSFEQYLHYAQETKHEPESPLWSKSPFIVADEKELVIVSYNSGINFQVSILIKWNDDIIVEIMYVNPGEKFDEFRLGLTYLRSLMIVEALGFPPAETRAKTVP